ncbi:F-box protein [Quillaja saponaria]|uniref:F-box protein n=1 Tax=Quillaja saponaria TaxID=32244 RepID=A0AAD7M1F3_QUISA|nr:F-box protein [Quillaja saponaria]
MAHWTNTSCKSATQACNRSLIDYDSKRAGEEENDGEKHVLLRKTDVATHTSKKAGEFKEESNAASVTFINESATLSCKRLRKETLECEPCPVFNLSEKGDGILSLERDKDATCNAGVLMSQIHPKPGYRNLSFDRGKSHLPSKRAWVPPETETLPGEYHHQTEGILSCGDLPVLPHNLFEKTSIENSISDIMPYGYNRGRTPMHSVMHRQHEINQSKEHVTNSNYHNYSSFLVHQKKTNTLLDSQRSGVSVLGEYGATPLPHDSSTSSDSEPDFVSDQHQRMLYSGTAFPSEATNPKRIYRGSSSLSQMHSIHDMETMRIYTVEESSRGYPKLSQTTNHLLISKKTDFKLSDRGQLFREPTISSKFEGNAFKKFLSFSPYVGNQSQQGVKIQALGSSTDNEGKDKVRDVRTSLCLKNESSAETNIMDINAFQENHLSGFVSSPMHKCMIDGEASQQSQRLVSSARQETKMKPLNTMLPDINEEPPKLPALASPVDDRDTRTSTSRTQSLDAKHFLSHAEQPANSRSSGCRGGSLGPEPSFTWFKRLKSSASASAYRKSSKMGETSSPKKGNKIFSKILNVTKTGTDPKKNRYHAEEQTVPNLLATTLTNGVTSSLNSEKKTQDISLSHPWIQRWSHIRAVSSPKKHEPVVSGELQPSKAVLEELQKKQFPSIAAMALMGKTMSGMHPCEFIKKGSSVVWNTKAF